VSAWDFGNLDVAQRKEHFSILLVFGCLEFVLQGSPALELVLRQLLRVRQCMQLVHALELGLHSVLLGAELCGSERVH
jgi:hypothetical protein